MSTKKQQKDSKENNKLAKNNDKGQEGAMKIVQKYGEDKNYYKEVVQTPKCQEYSRNLTKTRTWKQLRHLEVKIVSLTVGGHQLLQSSSSLDLELGLVSMNILHLMENF